MPLPLIVGLGAGIASAAAGIWRTVTGVNRIKKAQATYEQRRHAYEQSEADYRAHQQSANKRLEEFGQERLRATVLLGKAAEFLKRARVKDRDLFQQAQVGEQQLRQWEGASVGAMEVLGGVAGSVASGALTAAGTYGLVGLLGTASTGTAIGTLSGIAAQNAILAWLGGGTLAAGGGGIAMGAAVLGGLVVGPAVLVTSFFLHAKASKVETEVTRAVAEMDLATATMSKHLAYLDAVLKRVGELREATTKLAVALTEILAGASTKSYKDAYRVAKAAKSLAEVLDAAVLDKNGNPVKE
jgi:hypothetical protein